MTSLKYEDLTSRNHTYIPAETQDRIRATRVLIAGAGMGSTIGEAAVRMGFEAITLIDGDVVEGHNLNRQAFTASDIGHPKVDALAARLRAINPNAQIREINDWLGPANAGDLVRDSDLVFDAIDFLSMGAIVALHDECRVQQKPIVSVASAGFGAMAIYFSPDNPHSIREFFGLPLIGPVADSSYVKHFAQIVRRISHQLDPLTVTAMEKTFATMEDATPCPAPHLVIGSSSMAALAMTIAVRIFQGEPVTEAPELILFGWGEICTRPGLNLTKAPLPSIASSKHNEIFGDTEGGIKI